MSHAMGMFRVLDADGEVVGLGRDEVLDAGGIEEC